MIRLRGNHTYTPNKCSDTLSSGLPRPRQQQQQQQLLLQTGSPGPGIIYLKLPAPLGNMKPLFCGLQGNSVQGRRHFLNARGDEDEGLLRPGQSGVEGAVFFQIFLCQKCELFNRQDSKCLASYTDVSEAFPLQLNSQKNLTGSSSAPDNKPQLHQVLSSIVTYNRTQRPRSTGAIRHCLSDDGITQTNSEKERENSYEGRKHLLYVSLVLMALEMLGNS